MLDPIARYLKRLIDRPADADPAPAPAVESPAPALAVDPPAGGLHVAHRFPDSALDEEAVKVVRRLTGAGHEAFLVGGCVRDLLFGVRPKDFDCVTSAHPPEIRKLFRNCRIIGRRFRLAHVYFRDKIIEVATFRTEARARGREEAARDGSSGIIIRDDNAFGTAEEDARRRDFTINALFYDVDEGQIIDYVGGVADAERRLVRMIGDPDIRLREDPIRMLRAIRLASRLGCEIEPRTLGCIEAHRAEILDAASPRIGDEFVRMFRGGAMAPAFDSMLTTGVLGVVLPELEAHFRDAGSEAAATELQAMRVALSVADRRAQEGHAPSPAVLFALLLSPVLLRGLVRGEVRDPGRHVADRLRPIAQRLAISKRDSEKIRLILLAQDKLVPRRRRRRSGGSIVRRGYFPEALHLFELMTDATGDLRDEARRWSARLKELYPDGMPEPKRRRTPRSRRRREHGEKGARTG